MRTTRKHVLNISISYPMQQSESRYLGRVAPSPTGYLHLGHARTFWIAAERARDREGAVLLRSDDLDRARCREEFAIAMQEDLRWLGISWSGEMVSQSSRYLRHRAALERLHELGCIFPCTRSRRDVQDAAGAPHEGAPNDEPVYPKEFRPPAGIAPPPLGETISVNWRFRVLMIMFSSSMMRGWGDRRQYLGGRSVILLCGERTTRRVINWRLLSMMRNYK